MCIHKFNTNKNEGFLQTFRKGEIFIDNTGVSNIELFAMCDKCFKYFLIGYVHLKVNNEK